MARPNAICACQPAWRSSSGSTSSADAAREAPTFTEIAATLSQLTNRDIRCTVVDEEPWVAAQVKAGQQEFMARFMLDMYRAARDGYFAGTDPLLGELLGREPRTIANHLAASSTP